MKKYGFFHKLWLLQWPNDPRNSFFYFLNWFTFFPIWFFIVGYVKLVNSLIGHFKWNEHNTIVFNTWKNIWSASSWLEMNAIAIFITFLINSSLLFIIQNFIISFLLWPFFAMALIEIICIIENTKLSDGKTKASLLSRIIKLCKIKLFSCKNDIEIY